MRGILQKQSKVLFSSVFTISLIIWGNLWAVPKTLRLFVPGELREKSNGPFSDHLWFRTGKVGIWFPRVLEHDY